MLENYESHEIPDQASNPGFGERTTVEVDGELYYEDTGEFAGFVTGREGSYLPDQFTSETDLEHYLERLLCEEAKLLAEEAKAATIHANAMKIVNRQQARVQWLRTRFDAQAAAVALALMPQRSKTWSCAYGKVSFTTRRARLEVADKDQVLNYAEMNGYGACVKTQTSFLISNLPKDAYRDLCDAPIAAQECGFRVVAAMEVPTISTGLVKPKDTGDAS